LTIARLGLATGLLLSAALLIAIGGWWGLVIGVAQGALGIAAFARPGARAPLAGAVVALVPAPLAATRHWTARLPGSCSCARLPHPPPGLVSATGLVVAFDLALLGLALWQAAAIRRAEVEKSSL
jgi:hypothetical protein